MTTIAGKGGEDLVEQMKGMEDPVKVMEAATGYLHQWVGAGGQAASIEMVRLAAPIIAFDRIAGRLTATMTSLSAKGDDLATKARRLARVGVWLAAIQAAAAAVTIWAAFHGSPRPATNPVVEPPRVEAVTPGR